MKENNNKRKKMKSLIIKIIKKIIRIVLFIYLFIFIFIFLIIIYGDLTTNIQTLYKDNWNIDISIPKSVNSIYENSGFQFGEYLEILHYEKNEIQEICKKNNFIKITKENKEYLLKEYKKYTNNLTKEVQKLFDLTIQPINRFNENNYYQLIIKKDDDSSFSIALLIIDTNDNDIYSMQLFNQLKQKIHLTKNS